MSQLALHFLLFQIFQTLQFLLLGFTRRFFAGLAGRPLFPAPRIGASQRIVVVVARVRHEGIVGATGRGGGRHIFESKIVLGFKVVRLVQLIQRRIVVVVVTAVGLFHGYGLVLLVGFTRTTTTIIITIVFFFPCPLLKVTEQELLTIVDFTLGVLELVGCISGGGRG